MRRVWITRALACCAAVGMAFAVGCGSTESSKGAAGDDGAAADFKLGAGLALTGSFSGFDQPALEGIKIAVDEVNAAGGVLGKHKIVLDVKDVRSDPGQAVVSTKSLLQGDPNVLIVACMTDAAIPQGRLAQAAKVPAFSTCATANNLTTAVGDFMFGNFPTDTFEGAAAAQYARAKGYETAFLIGSPESSYTANVPKSFKAAFEARGGRVVGEANFTFNQQDFSPIVTRIKQMSPQPDVIETAMFEPAFPAFMKQLRAAGVKVPVLGAAGIDTPTVASAGNYMNGVMLPSIGVPEESPALAEFNEKVVAAAGNEAVTSYATRGYDLIKIIVAAAELADSIEPDAIRDAVMRLRDVEGLSTTTTYDYPGANGLPIINPTYMVEIDNGEKKLVETIELDPADLESEGD